MHPSVHVKTQADKPAFIMASTGETVTYGELEARSNRAAQLFRKLGLKVGDGVITVSTSAGDVAGNVTASTDGGRI